MYHVINRGNYRYDVFATAGAIRAFEETLIEASSKFGWVVHAYVIMSNHYHLALECPEGNLVEGMHWLQSTFATRFNRFRGENGHLFQGRYQAFLIEDDAALVRVVDYIHANPAAAKIVPPAAMAAYEAGSLHCFRRRTPWAGMTAKRWLAYLGFGDDDDGWTRYEKRLSVRFLSGEIDADERELCSGWAIGTHGWRRAFAEEYALLKLDQGYSARQLSELKEARFAQTLAAALKEAGKTPADAQAEAKGVVWKRVIAHRLRAANAPYPWIAKALHMGQPSSVRVYLCQQNHRNI